MTHIAYTLIFVQDRGEAGDNLGALCRGLKRDEVLKGMVRLSVGNGLAVYCEHGSPIRSLSLSLHIHWFFTPSLNLFFCYHLFSPRLPFSFFTLPVVHEICASPCFPSPNPNPNPISLLCTGVR